MGAAVLGDIMAGRADYWLTKQDYAECGAERLVDRLGSGRPHG
jgi:hypothetical protein